MAKTAEFEEKEYENPLNVELLFDNSNPLWTPGQVFEEHFGIDAALFASDPRIWLLFGYKNMPNGVVLNHYRWGYIWRKVSKVRELPSFNINLLLQAKRPHYRAGKNSSYASFGISGEYWQFEKTDHQQIALENLHKNLKNKALICYASAAFHTLTELYTHVRNHSLVDNSTFVQVHRIKGHKKWVYNRPGSVGLACSKIEKVEDGNFRTLLSSLRELRTENSSPLDNLVSLENAAIESFSELKSSNPLKEEFRRRRELITNSFENLPEGGSETRAISAYLTFTMACNLTNMTWFVI